MTDADGYARQPLAPTQEGYEFTGWYYDSSCTTPVDFSAPIVAGSGHATLFAGWDEVQAPAQETEILYSANGGVFADGGDTQFGVADADGYARQPLAPTREGYEFTGWYYDSACTDAVNFDAPIVAGSGHATLFAGWNEVQAPVQETEILYVANGGVFADGNGTMQGVADADGYARQPLAPTREGYDFAGWFYDSACTDPVNFDAPIVAGSGHATLFAGWTVNASIDILYVANGGVFADGNETMQGVTDSEGIARQPLAPTREGYEFAGWTYDSAGTDPVNFDAPLVAGSGHATLFAQWTKVEQAVSIDVLYVANGGVFADGNETMQGVSDSEGYARIPLQPTREGYTFVGWSFQSDGSDPVDFKQPLVAGSGHVTMFAQWKADEPQVQETEVLYVANGGVFADGNETMQGVTDSEGIARQPLAPTREGYEFAGWTYDSAGTDPVNFDAPLVAGSGHATLFAQWTKVEQAVSIDVLYVANGGVFADGNETMQGVSDSEGYARIPLQPTREGYTFVGWSFQSDGSDPVDFKQPLVAGSGHVTMFAQWKANEVQTPANEIEVLYVANGGVFFDGNDTLQGVTDSEGVARQPLAPTREGYTFAGWTYDAAGTDPVNFDAPLVAGSGHATLFAQWTANETPDQPDQPVNPGQPDQPSNPDQPSKPDQPSNPDQPATPDQPSKPDQPATPEQPSQPDQPSNPDQPGTDTDAPKPETVVGKDDAPKADAVKQETAKKQLPKTADETNTAAMAVVAGAGVAAVAAGAVLMGRRKNEN